MKKILLILATLSLAVFGYSMPALASFGGCNVSASCVVDSEGRYSIFYEVTASYSWNAPVNYELSITGPSGLLPPVTGEFTANIGSGSGSIPVLECGDYFITGSVTRGLLSCELEPLYVTCDCGEMLEGCTPGYWRNHLDEWKLTGYAPQDLFVDIFGFGPIDLTLGDAIKARGGHINELIRFATAALLNAAHPGVNPDSSVDTDLKVIALARKSFESFSWGALESLVDQDCPLN